jgi:hypothetical protein
MRWRVREVASMDEGGDAPGRVDDQPDPSDQPPLPEAGPSEQSPTTPDGESAPALVRPYVARHAQEVARGDRPAVDLRQVWAEELRDPSDTADLPAVIDVTVAAQAGSRAEDDGPGRPAGRAFAIAGAAVVVLLAIAGIVWAVGDRTKDDDLVLVVETTAGPPTSTPRRTPTGSLTPPATASPTSGPSRSPGPRPSSPSTTTPASPSPAPSTPAPTTTTAVPVPTTQPPPAAAKTGTVYSTSIQPRRCVDVRSANSAPGTPVQGYDCNGTAAQSVTFTTAGTMQILGRCVQPEGASVGALIVIGECAGGNAAQQWRVSGGAVRHLASGLCLGLPNADPANWIQLRLETCNGTAGQRWTTPL